MKNKKDPYKDKTAEDIDMEWLEAVNKYFGEYIPHYSLGDILAKDVEVENMKNPDELLEKVKENIEKDKEEGGKMNKENKTKEKSIFEGKLFALEEMMETKDSTKLKSIKNLEVGSIDLFEYLQKIDNEKVRIKIEVLKDGN